MNDTLIIEYQNFQNYEFKAFIRKYPDTAKATRGSWATFSKRWGIPKEQFFCVSRKKDGPYRDCSISYSKATFLIKKEWADEHLFPKPPTVPKTETVVPSSTQLIVREPLPSCLQLDTEEMFKTSTNRVFDIETRGERAHNKIYFKARDIGTFFEVERIDKHIFQPNSGFVNGIDYKIFSSVINYPKEKEENKMENTYFTYTGILHFLFTSHSEMAHQFQDWAARILFSHQLGTTEQRIEVSAETMGVAPKDMRACFDTFASSLPGVYLLLIGRGSDLKKKRPELDIKDEELVYKYGLSEDLQRRLKEHASPKNFGKNITAMKFSIIDPQYISKAEKETATLLTSLGRKIEYDDQSEVVCFDHSKMIAVNDFFKNLQLKYQGHTQELKNKVVEMENEHQTEIMKLKYEMTIEKNNLKHQLELKDKDNEVLRLKLELAELKIATTGSAVGTASGVN